MRVKDQGGSRRAACEDLGVGDLDRAGRGGNSRVVAEIERYETVLDLKTERDGLCGRNARCRRMDGYTHEPFNTSPALHNARADTE